MIYQTQLEHHTGTSPARLTSCPPSGTLMTMDERLEKLVTEAQQHAPQTQEQQLALTQLVEEILRSRKIGRAPIGQPLSGVYQEIYETVQQQLLHNVSEALDNYNPKHIPVRVWANTLRNQAFRTILDDAQIKKLAIEAQQHPPHTELRQHAIGELVEAIRLSGKLCRPQLTRFSPQFYDLLYDEAVNKTLTYVCRKINTYDPERGNKKFMNWVNFRLERVFIETYQEVNSPNIGNLPSLADLEEIVQPEEPPSLLERVVETLKEDAENLFKKTHVRTRPDANFQSIALSRFSGKTWEEISSELKIPLPTLSSFFQRCCEKFRSKLQP